MSKFYRVKAVLEYPGAQKGFMEGMFIPKQGESTPAKIINANQVYLKTQ